MLFLLCRFFEARELGASTILLIAAVLNEKRVLAEYINIARGVGFEPLVETHNEKEIELALSADAKIIGINNRNLHDFTEDIYTTVRLRELVPKDKVIISESSIHTAEDIKILSKANINGILVGESFMKSGDIKKKHRSSEMPMEIKICGLKRVEDALMVNEFESIKYVGFVFANTPRKITIEKALEIKEFKTRYKNCWCFCRTAYGRNN